MTRFSVFGKYSFTKTVDDEFSVERIQNENADDFNSYI